MNAVTRSGLWSVEDDGELVPAAHGRRVRALGPVVVDRPVGVTLRDLVEGDATLESGERGAEAEVQAVPERQVVVDLAGDVVFLGRRTPLAFVVVRRRIDQDDGTALRHGPAVVVDVFGD